MDLSRIHQIVLESMREAVYIRDLDMNILYINPASEQLTGWCLEEAKGKKCYEVFGDEHARCREVCPAEKAMAEGVHIIHHEGSLKTQFGEIHEMQVSISAIFGEEGVAGAVVVMEDITRLREVEKTRAKTVVALEREIERRKQAEEKLRESNSQKQAILDGITTNLAFVNEELEILWANKAAADSVAKLPSQMVGQRCHEFWADPDKPCDGCPTVKAFKTKRSEHTKMVTPDGRVWDEKAEPVFDADGRLIGVVEIALDITERQRAEEELTQSRQRLSLALEGANVGIWEWDLTTGKALWDEPNLRTLGYEPNESEPNLKSWKGLVHPEDWPRVLEHLNLHIQGKLPKFEAAYRILNKSGEWRWVLGRGNVIAVDSEGKPTRMVGVFADISDRKRAEEALRESEAKYRFLTDHASDLIWTADLNFRTTFVSPSVEKVLGFTPEERMAQDVEDQLTPECLEFARQRLREEFHIEREQGIQEGKSLLVDLDFRHRDGSIVCLQTAVAFIRDDRGNPIGLHGISRDITELKRSQEALRESEQKYRRIIENTQDLIYQTDMEGRIIFVSPSCELLLGHTPEECLGKRLSELYASPEETTRFLKLLMESGSVTDFEAELMRKDGSRVWVSTNAILLKDQMGSPIGVEGATRDVTVRKKGEEALRESETKYRSLFEQIGNAVAVYRAENDGEDFIFVDFNKAGEEIERISREQVIGKNVLEAFPAVKEFGLFDVFQRVWRTGEPENLPVTLYRDERIEGWRDNFVYKLPTGEIVTVYSDETDRKRAEDALRESEEKFSAAFRFAPMPMTLTSMEDGRCIDANDTSLNTYGYTRAEVFGKTAVELGFWKDEDERSSRLEQIKTEGSVRNLELSFPTKEGSLRHGLFSAVTIHLQGRPVLLSSFNDITDRRKAEEALRESEYMVRSILVATPVGLLLTENRLIKWANEEWEKMFGFKDESEYIGQPTSIMYRSEAQYLTARQVIYRNLENGILGETYTEFMRRDGPLFQAYLRSTYLDPSDASKGTLSAISDVTEIVRTERALVESEQRYRALFEDSRDAVFLSTRDGTVLDANQAFCDLFGYERNELESLNAGHTYADPAHRKVYQEAIEKTGAVKDFPVQLRKKDGTLLEVLLTASVRYGDKGEILGYQGIMRDVTEQRLLEKQLLQAQKMEAIGTLTGGIAHDFNNLLQVVLGYSELLLAEKHGDDQEYADLTKIFHSAKSGAELVQRLLMFSRKSESKPIPMNLNQQILQVEKLMRRIIPRMVDIHLELSDDLPKIHADPSQVEQVLMNLAVNARDAMPDGGKLTVRTSMVTLDDEYSRLRVEVSPGEYAVLEVSDTGHGMDKDTVEHIFEPFFTTKERGQGTGLGLAMVHGIVKQHNGHITVHSEAGKGTTFRVHLPAIPADVEPGVEDSGIMPAFGTETVLLVDDEELVRALGARILTKHGYTVLQAANGREALDLFEKETARLSLVILDLIMPGMGGRECLKGLLEIDPNVKVLIASGYSADGSVRETIQMGAKDLVTKPFRVKELLRHVRRVLDAS